MKGRLAKTKPLDLNAHPLADVLRRVLTDATTITVGDGGVEEIVCEIIDEGYGIGLGCKDDMQLTRIAALALAWLASEQKKGAPDAC